MSDPRHAFIDRWHRRNYRFDGQEVLSVTTINKSMYSYALEKWKLRRAVDVTLGKATRAMREVHRQSAPDDKGQRHYSGAVVEILRELVSEGVQIQNASPYIALLLESKS